MTDKRISTQVDSLPTSTYSRRRVLGVFASVMTAILPAALFVPLTGCSWKAEVVHADPALTSDELVRGKIAILPVKFDTDKFKPQDRSMCAQLFIRAVRQNREDIPVVSSAKLDKALNGSLEEEAEFVKIYEPGGMDPAAIAALGQSMGVRYLILTRLNYDQRAVGGGGRMANSTTESTLNGDVSILDSTTGHVVWQGKYSSTKSGIDTVVDPSPGKHGLPFFSTFVNTWPAPKK